MNTGVLLQMTGAAAEEVAIETANASGADLSLWEIAAAGEWYIMLPLAVLSIMAMYIFVERFLSIRKATQEEKDFMDKIRDYVHEGNLDAAKNLCATTDNPIARMIEKGVSRIGKPMKDISISIENVAKLQIYELERTLSTLATIAGAAPMIGFLGTVIGMMSTFFSMQASGAVKIDQISGGMMQAMVTTVAGLIVGIFAYVAYNTLVTKVDKVINMMESSSIEFMDLLEEPGK